MMATSLLSVARSSCPITACSGDRRSWSKAVTFVVMGGSPCVVEVFISVSVAGDTRKVL